MQAYALDVRQQWQVTEFAIFSAVLRDDFRPDSDIDVMVQFYSEAYPTFSTLDRMEAELKATFHRDVDFVTRQGIEGSHNYLHRQEFFASAQRMSYSDSQIGKPQL